MVETDREYVIKDLRDLREHYAFYEAELRTIDDAINLLKERKEKVEFIESYIKIGDGDYQWYDNHGELIRCKDCKYGYPLTDSAYVQCTRRFHDGQKHEAYWFCAEGERKGGR